MRSGGGWLDAKTYQPLVDAAWRAVNTRPSDGTLLDVGESTNKQRSLDDYLRRAALTGRDPRGGAMALVFAAELAGLDGEPARRGRRGVVLGRSVAFDRRASIATSIVRM